MESTLKLSLYFFIIVAYLTSNEEILGQEKSNILIIGNILIFIADFMLSRFFKIEKPDKLVDTLKKLTKTSFIIFDQNLHEIKKDADFDKLLDKELMFSISKLNTGIIGF